MDEVCRERVYSEDYLDFLMEYFPEETGKNDIRECFTWASSRFAVVYEEGKQYMSSEHEGIMMIPHCYGLLSSDQVLESAGITKARRQSGLNLFGQGIIVGFVDTGERVIILSSWQKLAEKCDTFTF